MHSDKYEAKQFRNTLRRVLEGKNRYKIGPLVACDLREKVLKERLQKSSEQLHFYHI